MFCLGSKGIVGLTRFRTDKPAIFWYLLWDFLNMCFPCEILLATKIDHWIRGKLSSRNRAETSEREEKLWRPTKNQTSSQPTRATQNKTWSPPWIRSGKRCFQGLYLIVFQFQLNRNAFHRYDVEFFVRNLESSVDKRGKPPRRIIIIIIIQFLKTDYT